MALDLRAKPSTPLAPAAMPAAAAPAVFRQGALPLPPGSVPILTPDERAVLEKLDWKQGDPIPDVAAMIDQIKQQRPDLDAVSFVSPDKLNPQVVDFASLSQTDQDRLREAVALGKQQYQYLEAKEKQSIPNTQTPDVNRAAEQLMDGTAQQIDLDETPPPLATAAAVKVNCPACGFHPDAEVVPVTEADKQNFLAMLIGGARFKKRYELLGGRMHITFKSLNREEMELALTQSSYDDRDGLFATQYEYFRVHSNYETVLAIDEIETDGKLVKMPEISEVTWDKPAITEKQQTVLKAYYPHVNLVHLSNASLTRVITLLFSRFTALLRKLEANIQNPDFWQGIERPV